MRLRSIACALIVLSSPAWGATANFVIDHKAFAEDLRVAAQLKAMSDARTFDETAARKLVPLMLVDGLVPEEQDMLYEFIAARSPVAITTRTNQRFDVPPPNGAARDYLTLLKTYAESSNVPALMDERWLMGPKPMKELFDMASFGPPVDHAVFVYVLRRFTISWMNGAAALGEEVSKFKAQLEQTDADTERRGKDIAYSAARDLDRDLNNAIPDELYAPLKR
jgi:hypothetical protein